MWLFSLLFLLLLLFSNIYLFILAVLGLSCGMRDLLIAACRLLSCRMQTLSCGMRTLSFSMHAGSSSPPEIEPGPPPLGSWSPTHWTPWKSPLLVFWVKVLTQYWEFWRIREKEKGKSDFLGYAWKIIFPVVLISHTSVINVFWIIGSCLPRRTETKVNKS